MNEAAKIYPSDKRAMQEVSTLLEQEGIRRICAIRPSAAARSESMSLP